MSLPVQTDRQTGRQTDRQKPLFLPSLPGWLAFPRPGCTYLHTHSLTHSATDLAYLDRLPCRLLWPFCLIWRPCVPCCCGRWLDGWMDVDRIGWSTDAHRYWSVVPAVQCRCWQAGRFIHNRWEAGWLAGVAGWLVWLAVVGGLEDRVKRASERDPIMSIDRSDGLCPVFQHLMSL